MCKKAGLLIAFDLPEHRAIIVRGNCNLWTCEECAARLRDRWVLRATMGIKQFLSEGLPVDFVTITSHEKLTTFAQTEVVWRSAWNSLYSAIKRRSRRFEYMIVPERHKDGRMHVHALWTAGVSKKWLKDNARKRGLGFMADVKHISAEDLRPARYISKYIGKDLGENVHKHFRRVRTSQGWTDIPEPKTDQSGLNWFYVTSDRELWMVMKRCEIEQIDMIDGRTNQLWDYEPIDIIDNLDYA